MTQERRLGLDSLAAVIVAFEGLSSATLDALRTSARRRVYRSGAVICRQGDPARRLELIESGRAAAAVTTAGGSEVTLGFLSPGDVIGEVAVLGGATAQLATVTAVSETTTLSVAGDEFARLAAAHPDFAALVVRVLAERLDRMGRSLVQELSGSAEERILRGLLALTARSDTDGAPVRITQEALGRMTGTARGTVNRVLRQESAVGTVRLGRGHVTVVDAAALRARLGAEREESAAVRERPAVEPLQRRIVTAAVLGLELRAPGDIDVERTGRLLAEYHEAISSTMTAFGASFSGFHGDTAVAVFGAPAAYGDDPQRAVLAAAAAIEAVRQVSGPGESQATIRVGVETGEAVLEGAGGSPVLGPGPLLQLASRLRLDAGPAEVLVGERTYEATSRVLSFAAGPGGRIYIGPAQTIPGYRVPMVGRSNELGRLWSAWESVAAERRPRLVTIVGSPGIGKTRLAGEICLRVEHFGGQVLRGRSLPFGRGLGYGSFVEMVDAAAGISDSDSAGAAAAKLSTAARLMLGGAQGAVASHLALMAGIGEATTSPDQHTLFRSACAFVEGLGRARPCLLLFEDLHWADASLLDLVEALAGRVRDAPVMLLATARSELLDRRPTWSGGLLSAETLELDGLVATDSAELAAALLPAHLPAGARDRVAEVAEGNPLFIEELAAALADRDLDLGAELPTTILNVIAARLDALPAAARAALVNASVIGRTFWRGALGQLVPHSELDASLDFLQHRGLLRREPASTIPDDEEFAFKHILVRDVAYGTLTRRAREQAHGAVARFLERKVGGRLGGVAPLLAHHWREAGSPDRSLRYLVEAAERAARAAAHREAVVLLTDAVSLAEQLGRDELGELRARLGIALARIGRWREARPQLEAAELAQLEPAERRIEVLIELAFVDHWLLDLKSCRLAAGRAVDLARETGRRDLEAAALGALAIADSSEGDVSASLRQTQASIAAAGDQRLQLMGPTVERCSLSLYWIGRSSEAVVQGEAALALGEEFADVNTSIRALGNLGLALAGCGRYGDALATFERARSFGDTYGTGTFLARAIAMCGGVHLDLFDYAVARGLAEEARALAASLAFPLPVVSAGIDLMFNWARLGEAGRAEELIPEVEEAVAAAEGAHGWLWRLRFAQARAETAAARGNWDEAWRCADSALARARTTERVKYVVAALGVQARTLAHRNRKAEAIAAAGEALRLARETGDLAMTMRAAAVVLELEPDHDATTAMTEAACAIASSLPEGPVAERFASVAGRWLRPE